MRQDPINPNLLYAGMEHGIFASWDKGQNWSKINNNLPNVSVRDIRIQARDRDLVVATHGRGAWILDDIRPLQEIGDIQNKSTHLFPFRKATLWHMFWRLENLGDRQYRAKNPEYGAYINYYLASGDKVTAIVDIIDPAGNVIRTLTDSTVKAGINRMVWDLGHEAAKRMQGAVGGGFFSGPMYPYVTPGTYIARLKVNGEELETPIEVRGDPRIKMSDEDYQLRTRTMLALRELLSQSHIMVNDTKPYDQQLGELHRKLKQSENQDFDQSVLEDIEGAKEKLSDLQDDVLKRPPPSMGYRQRPRLREEIRSLSRAINSATSKPTQPQLSRLDQLRGEINEAQSILNQIIANDIQKVNQKAKNVPPITVGKKSL